MKKVLFTFASIAALTLASCNKQGSEPVAPVIPADGNATVTVRISAPATKATIADTANEAKVNTLDVFVFRQDGSDWTIDAYAKKSATSISLTATQGERHIIAVVNSEEDLSAITTEAALMAKISMLKNNAPDSFVMVGSLTRTLVASNADVVVPVSRLAARIKIDKVTNNLTNSTLAAQDFKVVRFYLTSVADRIAYNRSVPAAQAFYATEKIGSLLVSDATEKASVNALIYNALSTPATVAHDASYNTPVSLYAYPNASATVFTHLVVEVMIGSKYYTYPIKLADTIDANKSYEIRELKITRPGNSSDGDDNIEPGENDTIDPASIDGLTVEVADWDLILVGDEGTVTI